MVVARNWTTLTIGLDRSRRIKNMNWLFRNWKLVRRFEVREHSTKTLNVPGVQWDAYLIAYGERVNGRTGKRENVKFETDYASKTILARILNRPIFVGLPIKWFGQDMRIGDEIYNKLPTA